MRHPGAGLALEALQWVLATVAAAPPPVRGLVGWALGAAAVVAGPALACHFAGRAFQGDRDERRSRSSQSVSEAAAANDALLALALQEEELQAAVGAAQDPQRRQRQRCDARYDIDTLVAAQFLQEEVDRIAAMAGSSSCSGGSSSRSGTSGAASSSSASRRAASASASSSSSPHAAAAGQGDAAQGGEGEEEPVPHLPGDAFTSLRRVPRDYWAIVQVAATGPRGAGGSSSSSGGGGSVVVGVFQKLAAEPDPGGRGKARVPGLGAADVPAACDSCMESFFTGAGVRAALQLPCGHTFCDGCVARLYEGAVRDTSLLPVRCCQAELDPALPGALLEQGAADTYRRKLEEASCANPMYCPSARCSAFIDLDRVRAGRGGAFACAACGEALCKPCKSIAHPGRTCAAFQALPAHDRATKEDLAALELIKARRWRRCGRCGATVERTYGCIHMTCRCRYEFCYMCSAQWRTCRCGE